MPKILNLILVVLLSFLPDLAFAKITKYEVARIRDFEKIFSKDFSTVDKSKTLVVFDIDHTLLKPKGLVGASYWFKWQVVLLQTPESEKEQLAKNQKELGDLTCQIFEVAPFELVETSTKKVFDHVVNEGFPVMLLTARSPQLAHGTIKQLRENGFDLEKDLAQAPVLPKRIVLSAQERKSSGLSRQAPVSYEPKGLMMTNEQDKGTFLKAALQRARVMNRYKTIILVDDSEKNVASLQNAFANVADHNLVTFLYTKEHPAFESFDGKKQKKATKEFDSIRRQIQSLNVAKPCRN